MEAIEAGRILARLQAHWPSLAATDAAADDWIRVIRHTVEAQACAELIVTGWDQSRAPKIADWQSTARRLAHWRTEEERTKRFAITGPRVSEDEYRAGLERARRALATRRPPVEVLSA